VKKAVTILAPLLLLASEPSAFEAGDLEVKNPYGLTKSEKYILKNKEEIAALKSRLYKLESRVSGMDEKLQGLQSVVEGIDERIRAIQSRLKNPSQDEGTRQELVRLRKDLNSSLQIQKENFASMKKVLKEMSSMIDTINANYVSKKELDSKLSKIYALLERQKIQKKSGSQLFALARSAYKNKEYQKAIEYYQAAAKKGYKPATSNFYIGESCYYSKDYACAVEHYKKSASLYAKASYMPTLLLHTAISLDRLGKKQEAKKFYESVIKLYPKSKAASIAKRYVKK